MKLEGQVGIITGGSSGIGAAIAETLSREGMKLVLASRNRDRLEQVSKALPGESMAMTADVASDAEVRALFDATEERFGQIDLVVNNAGIGLFKPIDELDVDEFDAVMDVNVRGVFLCTKYALAHMYRRNRGTVVTISSLAGKHGFAGGGVYSASKFAVMGLMESAFHEARTHDVRIVTICPGSVDTPFFENAGTEAGNRDRILAAEDVAEAVHLAVTLPPRALLREMDIRPANPKGRS